MSEDNNRKHVSIRVRNDLLECLEGDRELWRMAIDEILLIAEYSTDEGPWGDDYFLKIWSLENGQLMESTIPDSVRNVDATFHVLGQRLSSELQFDLTGSTEWASRVIWPLELAGHPYFTFREVKPANWREKLRRRFLGPIHEYFLSEEVREFLHQSKQEHT